MSSTNTPWDDAVLSLHGWTQLALDLPGGCPSGAHLGLGLEDNGEVGVVVSAFREDEADIPIYRPESIAVGDRITHVNGLRVRTANDLLACIDLELEKARQAGNGDDNPAVCVTVIREAEDSATNAETDAVTDAETVPTGTLGRGIFNLPSPTREESGESTNGASDATTAEVSAVGGREGRLADVEGVSLVEPLASSLSQPPHLNQGIEADEGGSGGGGGGGGGGVAISSEQRDTAVEEDQSALSAVAEVWQSADEESVVTNAVAATIADLVQRTVRGAGETEDLGGAQDDDEHDDDGLEGRPAATAASSEEEPPANGSSGLVASPSAMDGYKAPPAEEVLSAATETGTQKAPLDPAPARNHGGTAAGTATTGRVEDTAPPSSPAAPGLQRSYRVGDRVLVRDRDEEEWALGTVEGFDELEKGEPKVRQDGGETAFSWDQIRPLLDVSSASKAANRDDPSRESPGSVDSTLGIGSNQVSASGSSSSSDLLAFYAKSGADSQEVANHEEAPPPAAPPKRANIIHLTSRKKESPPVVAVDPEKAPTASPPPPSTALNANVAETGPADLSPPPPPPPPSYEGIPEYMAPRGLSSSSSSSSSSSTTEVGGEAGQVASKGDSLLQEREEVLRFHEAEAEQAFTDRLQHLIPVMNKLQDVFTTMDQAALRDEIGSGATAMNGTALGGGSSRGGGDSPLMRQQRRRQRTRQKAGRGMVGSGGGISPRGGGITGSSGGAPSAAAEQLELPQIVVLGAQSSGKSSVIEALVGREFLPRGTGIVTRRPLIVQLIHTPGDREWAEFVHVPGVKFGSYAAIRDEISRVTDELCGTNKAVAPQPISLRLYSPTVLNLTLVDLPGMTKVAVGDQPPDIDVLIQNLCLRYVRNRNAIILAVIPAVEDIANSEALKVAREVDPRRVRTIGVVTKCDLMDEGTDCTDLLSNTVLPLRLGYVAVVNRGQRANAQGMDVAAGAEAEMAWFHAASRPEYRRFHNRCTTGNLAKILNAALVRHIHTTLPSIKDTIRHRMTDVEDELDHLGDPVDSLPSHRRGKLLLSLLNDYGMLLSGAVNGTPAAQLTANASTSAVMTNAAMGSGGGGSRGRGQSKESTMQGNADSFEWTSDGRMVRSPRGKAASSSGAVGVPRGALNTGEVEYSADGKALGVFGEDPDELFGGARIAFILDDIFCSCMRRVNPFDTVSDADICMAISNANGHQPSLFVPETSFHQLVKRQIWRLERPALETVEAVNLEMIRLAAQVADHAPVARFPTLHKKVLDVVSAMLEKGKSEARAMVSNIIKVQVAWLNTSHPNFIGGSRAVLQAMTRLQEERERQRQRQAKIRARTLGVFGNPDKVETVLEGDAQGYAPPMEHSDPANNKKRGWKFWKKKSQAPTSPPPHHSRPSVGADATSPGVIDPHRRRRAGDGHVNGDEDWTGESEDEYAEEEGEDYGYGDGFDAHSGGHGTSARGKLSSSSSSLLYSSSHNSRARHRRHRASQYHGPGGKLSVMLPQMPEVVERDYAVKNEKEVIEVETVKKLVRSYFNVVRKQIMDYVPKTVMAFLVRGIAADIQGELVSALYSDSSVDEMITEDPDTDELRAYLKRMYQTFTEALAIVNDVDI